MAKNVGSISPASGDVVVLAFGAAPLPTGLLDGEPVCKDLLVRTHFLQLVREAADPTAGKSKTGPSSTARGGTGDTHCPLRLARLVTNQEPLLAEIKRRVRRLGDLEQFQIFFHETTTRATAQVDAVFEFLRDQGLTAAALQQRIHLSLVLLAYNMANMSDSYLKHKFSTLAWLALGQNEDPPERPAFIHPDDRSDVLIGGPVYSFLRSRLHIVGGVPTLAHLKLGQSFSQLKKGMPFPDFEACMAGQEKTLRALTTPREVVEDDLIVDRLLGREVDRTVDEIYPDGWYKGGQPTYVPSRSAHFGASFAQQGALGCIIRKKGRNGCKEPAPTLPPQDPTIPVLITEGEQLAAELPFFARDTLGYGCSVVRLPFVSKEPLFTAVDHLAQRRCESLNCAKPKALPEEFKVRTITLGPVGKYYRAKSVQKAVWAQLNRHPTFKLVGKTLSAEDLTSNIGHLAPGEQYVSGDFTAATDNIDPRLSARVVRRIWQRGHFNDDWGSLFVDSLVSHRLLDQKALAKAVPDQIDRDDRLHDWIDGADDPEVEACMIPQTWGQLMGSPTSFPILCIINAACARSAKEQAYNCTLSLVKAGLLINGDDIGFRAHALCFAIWKRLSARAGLVPSLGKNFYSKYFIILNSTMFQVVVVKAVEGLWPESCLFEEVPYINYGLLNGGGWKGATMDLAARREACLPQLDPKVPTVGALAHMLVRGHPEDLQISLLKRFLRHWRPALKNLLPRGMSYYTPSHLGGLGLPVIGQLLDPNGKEIERWSRAQRQHAAYLDSLPERQDSLRTFSSMGKQDDFSLWNKVLPKIDEVFRDFPVKYSKVKPKPWDLETRVRAELLAQAVVETEPDDKGLVEEPLLEGVAAKRRDEAKLKKLDAKYRWWRKQFEQSFVAAERSTFTPLTDDEILSSQPWYGSRRPFCDTVEFLDGGNSTVDLRLPFGLECVPAATSARVLALPLDLQLHLAEFLRVQVPVPPVFHHYPWHRAEPVAD